MADTVSPAVRSRMMAGIKSKDTRPELFLRKGIHRAGFRFRLHVRDLPGTPDIVLPKRNAVIFVHGCFWHGHTCHLYRLPKTRPDFWQKKIDRNRAVDARALKALRERKLRVGILWECALKGRARLPPEEVLQRTIVWLRTGKRTLEIKGSSLRSTSKRGSAISK